MDSGHDIYQKDVDFALLASQDSEFAKHLKSKSHLDFSDPEAVEGLTKALLKRDFKLSLKLPSDRLCPPIPNRLRYLLWIQDLLESTNDAIKQPESDPEVVGLDIGTGASCIYPLLGCAQHAKWKFIATDVDTKSHAYAQQNVQENDLESRIDLRLTAREDALIVPHVGSQLDFTMCNPPFYTSRSDLLQSAKLKNRPPNTACTGSPTEMIYPGGEVAFISRMIQESQALRTKVRWYTSMLGKYSSIENVVTELLAVGVDNWAVMEFVQGSKTRRWGIAWSFDVRRPSIKCARGVPSLAKNLLPFPAEYAFIIQTSIETSWAALDEVLKTLDLEWNHTGTFALGRGSASRNSWSRAARRKGLYIDDKQLDEQAEPIFAFEVQIRESSSVSQSSEVVIRWLAGHDSVIFESFCGMVKRKVSA